MEYVIAIQILSGALSAYFANKKGYPPVTAFLLGAILIFPVFIYAFLPDKNKS